MAYSSDFFTIPLDNYRAVNQLTTRPANQSAGGFPFLRPEGRPVRSAVGGQAPTYAYPGVPFGAPIPAPGNVPFGNLPNLPPYVNQPLPTLPSPGLEQVPGFDPNILQQIQGMLGGGILPQEQEAINIVSNLVKEAGAAAEARAISGAQRRGLTGSTIEGANIAQAQGATQRALAEAVTPITLQFSERAARRNEQLASVLTDIGKIDVQNKRDALFRFTDNLVKTGEFNINNITRLREVGMQLIQREIEDLRQKGFDEEKLKIESNLRIKEMENKLEQIRLQAELQQQQLAFQSQLQNPYQFPGYYGSGSIVQPRPGLPPPPGSVPVPTLIRR